MIRLRTLQVLMVLIGLALVLGLYPLLTSLFHLFGSEVDAGDQMILGIYFPLGIFLLLAVRNPSAHRSLIAFTGWSTVMHMAVMTVQAFQAKSQREDLPPLVAIALIGAALVLLTPRKESSQRTSSASNSGTI